MTSPCTADVLCLFERIAPESWFENLTPTTGSGSRRGIYSFAVVIWLMIVQRMQAKGTLGSALQQFVAKSAAKPAAVVQAGERQ